MTKLQTALEIALKNNSDALNIASLPDVIENTGGIVDSVLVRSTCEPVAVIQPELEMPVAAITSDKIVLGEALDGQGRKTGTQVTIGIEELYAATHIMGLSRHGKTALAENAFLQLAEKGFGAMYIDPHSEAISDILQRLPLNREKDVIILDVTRETHTFGINPLFCANPSSDVAITFAYAPVFELFTRLYTDKTTGTMGIWLQKFLSNSIYALLEHPEYTLAEIPKLLTDKAFSEYIAGGLRNREVADFFLVEFPLLSKHAQFEEIESTKTRLNLILQNPIIKCIVGQAKPALSFRDIIDTNKLLLVHFPVELPVDFRTLLGTMLITELQTAMFSRRNTPKQDRVPFFLIADEVQEVATQSFHKFIEQAGKFRVGTLVLHQSLNQPGMDSATRNAVLTAANKIYVRVNDSDTDVVAPGFAKAPPDAPMTVPRDVIPFLKYHEHPFVKWFYAVYLAPIEEALAKEGIRHEHESFMDISGAHQRKEWDVLPVWNFGSGNMEYEPDEVRKLRIAWNDLLYETQEQRLSNEELHLLWRIVVVKMSRYLDYFTFYECKYHNRCPDITPRLTSRTNDANETIAKLNERVEELDHLLLQTDDELVMQYYGYEYDYSYTNAKRIDLDLATAWERVRKEAEKNAKAAWTMGTFEGRVAEIRDGLLYQLREKEQTRDRLRKETSLSLGEELRLWYWKNWKYGTKNMYYSTDYDREELKRVEEKIAAYQQALASEDALLEYASTWDYYKDKGDIRSYLTGLVAQYADSVSELRQKDTPEKILANKRRPLVEERDGKKQAIEQTKIQLEMGLAGIKQAHDAWMKREQTRHDTFAENLDKLLLILQDPKYTIRVPASNTANLREKSEREMIDQAARELRNLPKYTAMCKLVDGTQTVVHKIALPPLPPPHPASVIETMTERIWQRMEQEYYRSKESIHDEITRRQELPSPDTGAFVKLPQRP